MKTANILKLSPYVLKRFEENLDGGKLFLYNVNSNDYWIGNASSFYLIRLIDGIKSLEDIYNELLPLFNDYKLEEIKQSFDNLLDGLVNRKFLEVVQNDK